MVSALIPILIALSAFLLGSAVLLSRHARRAQLAARLSAGVGTTPVSRPAGAPLAAFLSRFGNLASGGKSSRSLREELARAGFHAQNAAATFLGLKLLLLLAGALFGLALARLLGQSGLRAFTLVAIAATLPFFLPNLVVASRRRERLREITSHLPDAIDLLEIAVTAGMGIDQAWNSVSDEIQAVCPPLAEEMVLTNVEIHLGVSRAEAMRHMSERTGATELGSLVACMIQAERFGTSMRDALRNFANTLREARSLRAQEAAEKMAVKLLFPMILFIFPPALLVMAGPAFLSLAKNLGGSQ